MQKNKDKKKLFLKVDLNSRPLWSTNNKGMNTANVDHHSVASAVASPAITASISVSI